jgi:hypothetical protein
MSPEHGARLELRRLDPGADSVAYGVQVELPQASFAARAEIALDGAVSFAWRDAEPPEWCVTALRAQLRALFRERAARGGYPRRITRWRPGPGGESSP